MHQNEYLWSNGLNDMQCTHLKKQGFIQESVYHVTDTELL